MSEEEHRALKLHAVLQGRSVQGVVLDLIRADLAKGTTPGEVRGREDFVAGLLARLGIDPSGPEFTAAAARADASIQHSRAHGSAGGSSDGRRGVA